MFFVLCKCITSKRKVWSIKSHALDACYPRQMYYMQEGCFGQFDCAVFCVWVPLICLFY